MPISNLPRISPLLRSSRFGMLVQLQIDRHTEMKKHSVSQSPLRSFHRPLTDLMRSHCSYLKRISVAKWMKGWVSE